MSEFAIGPESLHLHLSVSAWAADGLLAIFFFVVGLELKREFAAGDLRDPRRAALPILAAIGGMLVPASIFVAINLAGGHPENLVGWAVPTATDIAFALAVLAVLSTHLPTALRTFLLTLAVVDDLLAIIIIAVFYTDRLSPGPLALALIPGGLFALAVQRGFGRLWLLVPLAVATWALVHASGVHATVAGVLLGFTVPVLGRHASAEDFEHILRPLSAGIAVPVFAFFAAGVTVCVRSHWEWPLAWCWASRSGCSVPRSCWPNSPARISTRTWRGATCSACHCWPASALPCRY
jgi:NhaA family Na+:H+ antiporter